MVDAHILKQVQQDLETLHALTREELVERWTQIHRRPPSKGISRRLLEYNWAYHVQAQAFGGLKPTVRRKLKTSSAKPPRKQASNKKPKAKPQSRLALGTRLVREWHGVPHTVDVVDNGFLYDNTIYKSLSEIARTITGARWSGPRFFGL